MFLLKERLSTTMASLSRSQLLQTCSVVYRLLFPGKKREHRELHFQIYYDIFIGFLPSSDIHNQKTHIAHCAAYFRTAVTCVPTKSFCVSLYLYSRNKQTLRPLYPEY